MRIVRRTAAAVALLAALAVAWGLPPPSAAAEEPSEAPVPSKEAAPSDEPSPSKEPAKDSATGSLTSLAQFVIPRPPREGAPSAPALPTRLTYQYAFGSESEILYRRDPDLNSRLSDQSLALTPQLNGYVTYRPTDWLEATLELIVERPITAVEEGTAAGLPSVRSRFAEKRSPDAVLLVDQAFATVKGPGNAFQLAVGRRNYEDQRHFLYDTSMDTASVSVKLGKFRAEAVAGREVLVDLGLFQREVKDLVTTYVLNVEYRGFEDHKLATYAVLRDDRSGADGRPLLVGVHAHGMPSRDFSYWAELAYLGGRDELSRGISAYGLDVGGTYRFAGVPLDPNVTLGYAFGSGDGNPNDQTNHEFRQTGLQSNETAFAGPAKFKGYGEALDPELSNLHVVTAGVGGRPAPNVSLDIVYHLYWLSELATEMRDSALTAPINQVEGQQSKALGSGVDIVLGLRNLFGIRRLAVDLRAGLFFPGSAFRTLDGPPENPTVRNADKGFTMLTKIRW